MTDAIPVAQLRSLIERVERIEEEIRELNADKSDIYKEAKAHGYDVKTIRKVVAKRKLDTAEREEQDAMFDLYWNALYGSAENASRVHVHTHEASPSARQTPAETHPVAASGADEDAALNTPGPANPGGFDGNPSEPKDEAGGAKNGGADPTVMDRTGTQPGIGYAHSSRAVTDIHARRPHCMHKDACRGQGGQYCRTCLKALETEAA